LYKLSTDNQLDTNAETELSQAEALPLEETVLNTQEETITTDTNESPAIDPLETSEETIDVSERSTFEEFTQNMQEIVQAIGEQLSDPVDSLEALVEATALENAEDGDKFFNGISQEDQNARANKAILDGKDAPVTFDNMDDKGRGLRGGTDPEEERRRDLQKRLAIEAVLQGGGFQANAMSLTQGFLSGLLDIKDQLINNIQNADATIAALDQAIDEQTVVVEESQAAVSAAKVDLDGARLNVQTAEERLDGATQGFNASATELANAENQTRVVVDRGWGRLDENGNIVYDDPPTLYVQNDDGSWVQGSYDDQGNINFVPISDEEAAKFQSNNMSTDMYLRLTSEENPDGTTSIVLSNGGFSEDVSAQEQAMLDAYTQTTGTTVEELAGSQSNIDSANNMISGSFSNEETEQANLNLAQEELAAAEATLGTALNTLGIEQQRLQSLIDDRSSTQEQRDQYQAELDQVNQEIAATEDFQQRLENGEFENEQDMIDAMPDSLRQEYLAEYGEPEIQAQASQEPVRATTDVRGTSFTGYSSGDDSLITTAYNTASGITPAQTNPDPTQDQTLDPNANNQSYQNNSGMGGLNA
jgi:hypothetical protein